MATEIKMPQLSDTMSSGKILGWKKKEGDQVKRGDVLAEVETDKANLEIECYQNGHLLKIAVPVGNVAQVGQTIAYVGELGESLEKTVGSKIAPSPGEAPKLEVIAAGSEREEVHSSSDRIKASPLARKIARDQHIDLSLVRGSGPSGRIIKKDLEGMPQAASQIEPVAIPTKLQAATPGTSIPMSTMRQTIARRMQESMRDAPHFYVTISINMNEAVRLREALKERAEFKGIGLNHLIIKAVAYALEKEPTVNCALKEGMLYSPANINIGIITAVPDGLLIPVLKEANRMSLKDLVFEARAAVDRARAGRPNAADLVGGTFSISNMGMFDVENFTAIINPGQGGVLAVSATQDCAVVEGGQVRVGKLMKATISVDHRIIDGLMAASFMKHFKEALETPALLLL